MWWAWYWWCVMYGIPKRPTMEVVITARIDNVVYIEWRIKK